VSANIPGIPLKYGCFSGRMISCAQICAQKPVEKAQILSDNSRTTAAPKPSHRSQVTNGSCLLPGTDGRSTWNRRCRDLIELFSEDLGGAASLSAAKAQLVRRVAVTIIELEALELKFAIGDGAVPADLDLYQRTTNTLRRNFETLGLERLARDVTPDLRTYLQINGNPA